MRQRKGYQMQKNKQIIRDFYGKIIGSVETDFVGNKTVRDFYGKVLGTYNKKQDVTRDFYGRMISKGDASAMLLNLKK